MAGMGPPPKPDGQRARRNATIAMTRLPADGRQGRAPAWPLPDDVLMVARLKAAKAALKDLRVVADDPELTPRQRSKVDQQLAKVRTQVEMLDATIKAQRKHERTLWTDLWHTPQAVMWERLQWTREVAQYVRWKVRAELGDIDASKEARQLGDRLGLNPLALLRLRWEIPPVTEVAETPSPKTLGRSGSRGRYGSLRVVGE